jgi:tRNA(fMet)-specific endonuclease VapC
LAAQATPIGANDTMIAGHAIAAGCVLITNNTREFCRLGNLRVDDWTQAARGSEAGWGGRTQCDHAPA